MKNSYGKFDLYQHQITARDYSLQEQRCLLALEQGLGKTIVAGAYLAEKRRDKTRHKKGDWDLIVCPASLRINWQKELRDCDIYAEVLTKLSHERTGKAETTICSYEYFTHHNLIKRWYPRSIIFDESHFLKNCKNKQVKKGSKKVWVMGSKRSRAATWFCRTLNPRAEVKMLTGTPYISSATDIVIASQILNNKDIFLPSFEKKYCKFKCGFCEQISVGSDCLHCGHDGKGKYRHKYFGVNRAVIKDLRENHLSRMLRMRKADCVDLPEKIRAPIWFEAPDFSPDMARLQQEYQGPKGEKLIEAIFSGEQCPTEKLSSLRMELGLKAVEPCIELIRDQLETGEPLVVFGWHKQVIAELHEAFPHAAVIVGETTPARRDKAVTDFQSGATNLMLANVTAGGTGYTFTAAHRMLFVELPWTGAELEQAEDRIHRIGQEKNPLINYFLFQNTLHGAIYKTAMRKIGEARSVIDNEAA